MRTICSGSDITKSGLWLNTHVYRTGDFLNADVYLVHQGQARVVKASVDMRPIAKAVAAYHKKRLHQAMVSGEIDPEMVLDSSDIIGFSFSDLNPIKHVKRAVRNVGRVVKNPAKLLNPIETAKLLDPTGMTDKLARTKLARQVNKQLQPIVNVGQKAGQFVLDNPIITKGVLGAATVAFPPAAAITVPAMAYLPAASAANKAIGAASRIARGKGNLLDTGLKTLVSQATKQIPLGKVANDFAKYVPKDLQNVAKSGAIRTLGSAVKQVGGAANLKRLTPKQWGGLMRKNMPGQLKQIAREGLIAKNAKMPRTANLMPKVSKKTLGLYAIANRMVKAAEQGKGLQNLRKQMGVASAIPSIEQKLRRDMGSLKLAQKRLNQLPPIQRAAAARAIANKRKKLFAQAQRIGTAKRAIGNQIAVAKKIGPANIAKARRDGVKAAIAMRQIRAAASSPNPRVREQARQAAAALKVVARTRHRVRQMSRGKLPGFSVAGSHMANMVGAPALRMAEISEVMPTIGGMDILVGCADCHGTCGA